MSRSYTSSPPSAFVVCSGTALALKILTAGTVIDICGYELIEMLVQRTMQKVILTVPPRVTQSFRF
jgi:hypothetical protein